MCDPINDLSKDVLLLAQSQFMDQMIALADTCSDANTKSTLLTGKCGDLHTVFTYLLADHLNKFMFY